ncbi:membrane protein [Inquilinus limosus MP06]|uniref:Membrane protein n=1 Tax=Inquilinus limosus MP06 TaxID=1398085 RepID=A0A0A0DCX7_9PROT|nr:membrane protein [Inquilinus limosus MP06]
MAEFRTPEHLLEAAKQARKAGFRRIDATSPFPVEGLAEVLGFRDNRVPLLTLAGGAFGALLGYGMQVFTNHDFPLDVGGRPLVAPPAFTLITFELMVLFAVLAGITGMLALNRLPRLNHPLFEVETFRLDSPDAFFLIVFADDPRFDRARRFLEELDPVRVDAVPPGEEPA